jgi:hypothetical protein
MNVSMGATGAEMGETSMIGTRTRVQKAMAASVGNLVAERRRLEEELTEMEQKMTAGSTDDLVRELKRRIDERDAEQARDQELLERAEAQAGTLARDRAAEASARRQARVDTARQALRGEVAAYMAEYAALVRHLRGAAAGVAGLMGRMQEIGVLGKSLAEDGRLPSACSLPELERRLGFLVAHAMRRIPGKVNRLGTLEWPAFADAEHPVDQDPVERERERLQRQLLDVLAGE